MRRDASIAGVVLLASGAALGDGVSALIEETGSVTRSRVGDQSGGSIRNDVDQFVQRYRLSLERLLWPLLRVGVGGTFEQFLGASRSGDISSDIDSRASTFFANVAAGGPILNGVFGYSWREQTSPTSTVPFGFVNEDINLLLSFRPTDLPWLSLRLARPSLHDRDSVQQDITTRQALFSAIYDPVRQIDLRYSLDFQNPIDRIHHTELDTLTQSARASYEDRLFGGRTSLALAANVIDQQIRVVESNAGGTTTTVLSPVLGLSLVEAFPATPQQDTLVPNVALINADLSASAGLNLGTSASLAGDVANRDMGAQLADAVTSVNAIRVWIDRQLPPALAATLRWTAWQSADNVSWIEVPIAGQVIFDAFQPRFDIAIPATQARYLKVVTRPLAAGASVDPAYRDVFLTELQLLLVSAAPGPHGWHSTLGATFNASARTQLFSTPILAHDISFFATRGERPGSTAQNTYLLTNGLTFTRALHPAVMLSARVARQDAEQSRGHEGEWLYTASLAATPLRTLTGSAVYSGKQDTTADGRTTSNALSLFAQATPWRGIGLLGNVSYSVNGLPSGQSSSIDSLVVSATLQPHPALTVGATYGRSAAHLTGGGLAGSVSVSNRFEGTLTFTPVRSLYLSAGATRTVGGASPVTLANGSISFSPFQGGDLQLGLVFTESLEGDGSVTRLLSPSVRWKIGRAIVTVSYAKFDNDSAVTGVDSHTYTANLRIPL